MFDDVTPGSTHARAIAAIAADGITQGCTATLYCPADPVTRAQMASFLARALDLEVDLPDHQPRAAASEEVQAR